MKTDWEADVIDYLINAGTVGRDQSDLLRRFQGRARADMITDLLDAHQLEDRVQKFVLLPNGGKGRRKTIWRATTKMVQTNGNSTTKPYVDDVDTINTKAHTRTAVATSTSRKRTKKV